MAWHLRTWAALTRDELHAILRLRAEVFVVEQRCAYQDVDGLDPQAQHLWQTTDGGDLAPRAYARVFAAGVRGPDAVIGRVAVAPAARGHGTGAALMRQAIAACGDAAISISAQAYLEHFYAELGFARTSADYLEDGIPHLAMRRAPP
jgi:ElaA protein